MEERDVIINAFSCSAQAPCHKWSEEFFDNPPIVLNVPGSGGSSFRRKAIQWAKTGDVFSAALKELKPSLKNIKIRKRLLTTFSVGWTFADELLKFKKERNLLNSYLLLDGMHSSATKHWSEFAKRAVEGSAFMVMAHSSITPPFISARKSNSQIFDDALMMAESRGPAKLIPKYISSAQIESGSTKISLGKAGNLPAITKIFKKDPLIGHKTSGSLTRLHYDGNDRPDHVYVAWHVSKKLWKWLGEEINESPPKIPKPKEPGPDPIPFPAEFTGPSPESKKETPPIGEHKDTQNILQIIWAFILSILSGLLNKRSK